MDDVTSNKITSSKPMGKDITPFNPLLYCVAVETAPNEFLLMKNGIESQCENWEWKLLEKHIEEVYVNDSCINSDT